MRNNAIIECRERLSRAEEALAAMRDAEAYNLFRRHWSYFLFAAAGVYSMLHEGAKGCNKSRNWFNLRKHERDNDPLLSYVHHARNSAEHGLGPLSPQAYKVEPTPGITVTYFVEIDDVGNCVFHKNDPSGEIVNLPLVGELSEVTDSRYGTTFSLPTSHLGSPINDPSAVAVGTLALDYLRKLVAEADKLPVHG